ncbi:hypothetical protein GGQ74_001882 [Desulfobaculum xiamenense]|uniref:Class III cytochrome C domain-containing protein n=1 Tax=Desulfobaculum xiamenense TaxID=995050 RepID=A0A846QU86_9BACT|nr:cytochrome c3 family protein [Desulfobaculum xiamenense]NJB68209.1 hypothetical protein [Desulfobaculum xiamenense]
MKKILSLCVVCFAVACFCALPVLNAADAPADGLKMAKTAKAVVFNHGTHKDAKCQDCHHKWDGASAIKKCSDAGCHDNFDKKAKDASSYYQAMHAKKVKAADSCISCHLKAAGSDKDKKKQLTGCKKSACHPE